MKNGRLTDVDVDGYTRKAHTVKAHMVKAHTVREHTVKSHFRNAPDRSPKIVNGKAVIKGHGKRRGT